MTKRYFTSNYETYLQHKIDIDAFYKNLNGTNFKGITRERILELNQLSLNFNQFYSNQNLSFNKCMKYIKIMNRIKTSAKHLGLTSEAEKFITFMLSVDPNFEAAKIYGEFNKNSDVKDKMQEYFGVYDSKLIILENFFIKHFLSENAKNKINEEIEKRVFK